MPTMEERFWMFHMQNPHVLETLREMALALKAEGMQRASIDGLTSDARWIPLATQGESFKLPNGFRPFYARLLADTTPALRGFFEERHMTRHRYDPPPELGIDCTWRQPESKPQPRSAAARIAAYVADPLELLVAYLREIRMALTEQQGQPVRVTVTIDTADSDWYAAWGGKLPAELLRPDAPREFVIVGVATPGDGGASQTTIIQGADGLKAPKVKELLMSAAAGAP